ncbi:MAG: hypothetical protein ACREDZ_07535 [Kiloniellales bacterium]
MPADNRDHGAMSMPLRLLKAWRQRRSERRRTRMHSFMGMSDRALADIGVRRADVYGALIGAVPLAQAAVAPDDAPSGATIRRLPPRPTLTIVPNDLDAAA